MMIDDAMCVSRRRVCLAMINEEATQYKTRIVMWRSHHGEHSANCDSSRELSTYSNKLAAGTAPSNFG